MNTLIINGSPRQNGDGKYIISKLIEALRGKVTAGGDCRDIKRPIETAEVILKHINTELVGLVSTMNTNEIPACKDDALNGQISTLAEALNYCYVGTKENL